MASRSRVIATLLILLVVIALCALWRLQRDDTNSTRRLPDGTTVTLKEVAYQRVYRVRTGNRIHDYLGLILPERWAKWLGCRYASFGATNQLSCCLEIKGAAGANVLSLFDEHGCESGLLHPSHVVNLGTQPPHNLLVFPFYQFPRRAEIVGVRLGGAVEFIVPNPARRDYPQWKPEPFPITRQVGSTEFTLLEVKSGVVARRLPLQILQAGQKPGAYVRFRISEKGKLASAWEPHIVSGLSDACNHTISPVSYGLRALNGGEYVVAIETGLCTEETAWRLQIEFSRTAERVSVEYLFKPSRATLANIDWINSQGWDRGVDLLHWPLR